MITSLLLLAALFLMQARMPLAFLATLGTLLVHVQLSINQYPQVHFLFTVIRPLIPKPLALPGVVVAKAQKPAFGLVEPHPIGFSPAIQPVQIPL